MGGVCVGSSCDEGSPRLISYTEPRYGQRESIPTRRESRLVVVLPHLLTLDGLHFV